MKKLMKYCLALFLLFGAVPLNTYAQSNADKIIINDLIGEERLVEKTKHLIKINLIDRSNGEVHKVLYYLTPNTFDISINQIKEALSSQKIDLDLEHMEDAEVDTESKKYQTNLGELSQKLVTVNIPLINPSEVPITTESESDILTVVELEQLANEQIVKIFIFKDENDKVLHQEYFLVYTDHSDDLLKMASDKFKEKFPEYTTDETKDIQPKPVSTQVETFLTDKGEIKAFSMETIVPVQQKEIVSSESTSDMTMQSSMSEVSSESKTEMSISQLSVSVEKSETSSEVATSTNQTKKNLPSTGKNSSFFIIGVASITILLGILTSLSNKVTE